MVDPDVSHSVGLVVPDREPLTPSARHLVRLAGREDVLRESRGSASVRSGRAAPAMIRVAYRPIEAANLIAGARHGHNSWQVGRL